MSFLKRKIVDLLSLCNQIDVFFAVPSTLLFFGVGCYLTMQSRFIQIRAFPRLLNFFSKGIKHHHRTNEKAINPLHALLTSMATTIGMGTVVGPSVAIKVGGPGALFWLVAFSLVGAATKFTEVLFSMKFRTKLVDGTILGGPSQYLKQVSPTLAYWYGGLTVILFAGWSGLQANTLANIFALEGVDKRITGLVLAAIALRVLMGGIKRVSDVASKLVPIMFIGYVSFAWAILFQDLHALGQAFLLIFNHILTPHAALGGFAGASVFTALRFGVLRNIHITEAGLGTSSVSHAMADTDNGRDQAVLAMYSMAADMMLAFLSGLLVLVTGVWLKESHMSNTLVYQVFKDFSPLFGKWVLLLSISLFILTTVIGNSFNASQSFASFTQYRGMRWYYLFLGITIFSGALLYVPLAWALMDIIMIMVAIPHLVGLLILSWKHKDLIR